MAEIIDLSNYLQQEPDPADMTREELLTNLQALRQRISELDEREPADMDSEAYESWGDAHEALEDRVDEILDRLDELK
ncbi:MAG: hypothetical protein LKJ86_04575 [Oscillibacter sp.]|nr:hypothetical protein [Oscillibacter sp.]